MSDLVKLSNLLFAEVSLGPVFFESALDVAQELNLPSV